MCWLMDCQSFVPPHPAISKYRKRKGQSFWHPDRATEPRFVDSLDFAYNLMQILARETVMSLSNLWIERLVLRSWYWKLVRILLKKRSCDYYQRDFFFGQELKVIHAFLEVLLQCVDANIRPSSFRTEAESGWIVGMHKMGSLELQVDVLAGGNFPSFCCWSVKVQVLAPFWLEAEKENTTWFGQDVQ